MLSTTLVHHQHWFPVLTESGAIKEAFLAVVNTQPADERLIAKNAERVVAARLRDAKFFWEADRQQTLESRLDRLHTVLFHKKLGSYRDKSERIEKLAAWIATEAFGRPDVAADAAKAARLAKADLTSDMVFEFPELQGTMGGIYAREEGQPEQVWKAIYHQYLPIGVEADAPPSAAQLGAAAATWAAVSLADKLDTVVGLTNAGEKSTGSRDPFGLRRQMHGIVRILMDLPELVGVNRELGVENLVAAANENFGGGGGATNNDAIVAFARERVEFALQQRGFAGEVVRGAVSGGKDASPLRALRLANALQRMRGSEDFQALAVLFKRVKNIARELKAHDALDRAALTEPAELALLAELDSRRPRIAQATAAADYRHAFTDLAGLRSVVDQFFKDVFVMAEDERVKTARLTLMADLRNLILESRRHFGNRSTNGVGQVDMAKKQARKTSVAKSKSKSKGGPKASPKRSAAKTSATAKAGKYVYNFGRKTDGNGSMKALLGGKGANLGEMCRIGLPVPPGFTVTTEVCTYYYANKRTYPPQLRRQMEAGIAAHRAADRQEVRRPEEPAARVGPLRRPRFDARHDGHDPQPRSQRQTVEALATKTGNARFAWDCYRRFVQMYGDVVLGVQKRPDEDHEPFEVVIEKLKHERYHQDIEDTKLSVDDLQGARAPLQGAGQGAHRQELPGDRRGIS